MGSSNFFEQLGINWQLFLGQAVNFFILLFVLQLLVYKPILRIIKDRRKKIQQGLEYAKEAEIRLHDVDQIAKRHLQKADQEAVEIIKATQERARQLEASLRQDMEHRQKDLEAQVAAEHQRQQEAARQAVLVHATELVKRTVAKTITLDPSLIDEALVKKAIHFLQHEI